MNAKRNPQRQERRPDIADAVAVSRRDGGFAYAPGQVLFRAAASPRLVEIANATGFGPQLRQSVVADRELVRDDRGWWLAENVPDPLAVIDLLNAEGFEAEPNYAFFAHSCGSPCPPHPAALYDLLEYGFLANPLRANPLRANPLRANPLRANPLRANRFENTAVPAPGPRFPRRTLFKGAERPTVVVLDTGIAQPPKTPRPAGQWLPLDQARRDNRISGDPDEPDQTIYLPSGPVPADNYLDPAAGHGTFIAGIIEQLAPGCEIVVRRVIDPLGYAFETQVADAILKVVDELRSALKPPVILNLSFGGPAPNPPAELREAVAAAVAAGIVIVASAGNDGVCAPQYPAAFPGVIAVGGLGPDGPAPWTNYGDWVDACAPGTDLVSSFFEDFNGAFPSVNSWDPDCFEGWAEWSGTSFAAPIVVAAIARELALGTGPFDAVAAAERVIDAPHLTRIPCLGTVINI